MSTMAEPGTDTTPYDAVFVDTSLNTHFATAVSFSDTVSDLKQKIIKEHLSCFPEIGDIKIHALMVKRRGCFYHLSDSMLVTSAFRGINNIWFVKVDASSSLMDHDDGDGDYQLVNNTVPCVGMTSVNNCVDNVNLLPDASQEKQLSDFVDNHGHLKRKAPVDEQLLSLDVLGGDFLKNLKIGAECSEGRSLKKDNLCEKENEIVKTPIGGTESNFRNKIDDAPSNVLSETALETGSRMKKKHKSKKKNKHVVNDLTSKEDVLVPEAGRNESRQEIVVSVVSHDDVVVDGNTIGGSRTELGGNAVVSHEETGMLEKHIEPKSDKSRRSDVNMQSDKPMEDTMQSEPVAKKKRRTKEEKKDGEDLLEKHGTLFSESNEERAEPSPVSQHSIVDKQNNKNPTLGSSCTKIQDDAHLQSAGTSSGKRKRKMKSSKISNQEILPVPSSGTDIGGESTGQIINLKDIGEVHGGITSEPDAVSLKEKHGDPVQEVTKRLSLQEIDMSHSAVVSDTKSMKVSEDHPAINVEGCPHPGVRESDNRRKDTEVSRLDNMILRDSQNHVVDQTNGVGEEQNLSLKILTKTVPSENYRTPAVDELASNTKEVAVTSKLVEASETVDPPKSSKKKKKSKKIKEFGSVTPSTSVAEHVEGFVSGTSPTNPYNTANGDHTDDNVNKEEVSEKETSASLLATEKEIDAVIQNAVQSVQQIGKFEVSAENMDGKSRKKSRKKKQNSDAKNLPDSKNENEKAYGPSADNNTREIEFSSNSPLHSQSSLGQPHKTKRNSEGRSLEAVGNGDPSKSGQTIEGTNKLEVSCESSRINFNDYFVPSKNNHNIVGSGEVLVDGTAKAMEADGVMKASKSKKKLDTRSHCPSSELQSSHTLNKNYGVKVPPSNMPDKLNSVSEIAERSTVKHSGSSTNAQSKNAVSNSSFESSKNRRANGRQSHKDCNHMNSRRTSKLNTQEVVSGSVHKKSLIGAADSIFNNDTDGASSTEDDNSDAITRTPSDKSPSSDYSDGESNADFRLSQNGSHSWRRKEGDGTTVSKPLPSGMTLDTILRSSSRYKKAKLTAAQLQLEETESQPVEIVPDSQANH